MAEETPVPEELLPIEPGQERRWPDPGEAPPAAPRVLTPVLTPASERLDRPPLPE